MVEKGQKTDPMLYLLLSVDNFYGSVKKSGSNVVDIYCAPAYGGATFGTPLIGDSGLTMQAGFQFTHRKSSIVKSKTKSFEE